MAFVGTAVRVLEVLCNPSATVRSVSGIKETGANLIPQLPPSHLASVRYAIMSKHSGFLSRSVTNKGLLLLQDPFSDEAAQEFLKSKVLALSCSTCFALCNKPIQHVELTLETTFRDTKVEFEDLDGLYWPNKPTPPMTNPPNSPSLGPLFSPGDLRIPTTIYDTDWDWVDIAPPSPASCKCSIDRSACKLHARKLSRTRRCSDVNLAFPRPPASVPDPFSRETVNSVWEEEWLLEKKTEAEALTMRHPLVKQAEGEQRPFKLLELPPLVDLSSLGPPPGLPPPIEGLQPLQGIPFPMLD